MMLQSMILYCALLHLFISSTNMELLFSYILIRCLWFPSLWREVMTYSLIYHGSLTNENYAICHQLKLLQKTMHASIKSKIFCILCPLISATLRCLKSKYSPYTKYVHKLRPCKHPLFFCYLEILC